MSRPGPSREQGFGLLGFVIITALIVLFLVAGYSGLLTQQAANSLKGKQEKYLYELSVGLEAVWDQHAGALDRAGASNTTDEAALLQYLGVSPKYGTRIVPSSVLVDPVQGLAYRVVAIYIPTETDATTGTQVGNGPDLVKFANTGVFNSCANPSAPCDTRVFRTFNSMDLEREKFNETELRLRRVAAKAQSYFKARMLQDPERSISTNYFYKPSGSCAVSGSLDLGCIDTYQAVTSLPAVVAALGLTDEETMTAWGDPIMVSNVADSNRSSPPFTMAVRAQAPNGTWIKVLAVQQI